MSIWLINLKFIVLVGCLGWILIWVYQHAIQVVLGLSSAQPDLPEWHHYSEFGPRPVIFWVSTHMQPTENRDWPCQFQLTEWALQSIKWRDFRHTLTIMHNKHTQASATGVKIWWVSQVSPQPRPDLNSIYVNSDSNPNPNLTNSRP